MRRWVTAALAMGLVTGITGWATAAEDGRRKGDGERPPGAKAPEGERPAGKRPDGERPPGHDDIFKRMDKNGDGKVSRAEFLAAPPPPRPEGDKGAPPRGPKDGEKPRGPREGDGDAPKGERKGPPPREEIFKHLDANGDGVIDKTEWAQAPKNRPPAPREGREGDGKGKRPPGEGDGKRPAPGKGDRK